MIAAHKLVADVLSLDYIRLDCRSRRDSKVEFVGESAAQVEQGGGADGAEFAFDAQLGAGRQAE